MSNNDDIHVQLTIIKISNNGGIHVHVQLTIIKMNNNDDL